MAKLCVMTTNKPLSAEQAAAELGISRRALLHRIKVGAVRATKLGDGRTSAYVITRDEIERVKAEKRKAAAS